MSYPTLPKNRLIVDGVDLTAEFKMVLSDNYTLGPPEIKTYTVDIPGGNGKIDLTESLLGDTAYGNRKQEFTFYIISTSDFEKNKTEVSNFLHGKSFDYKMTMDPGYTYHGRFSVTEYAHAVYNLGTVGVIKVEIDAKPFKLKDEQVFSIDAVGGKTVYLESGRMRVRPAVETDGFLKVIFNNKLITLPQGTWTINDVLLTEGSNEIYFNSYDIRNLTWGDLKTSHITWRRFKEKRLYEWYKANGDGNYVNKVWSDLSGNTWASVSKETWADQVYKYDETKVVKKVYVKYDWGDL